MIHGEERNQDPVHPGLYAARFVDKCTERGVWLGPKVGQRSRPILPFFRTGWEREIT